MSSPDDRHIDELTQVERFRQAARQLGTDDDPDRFKERVGKLVKHKPVEPLEPDLS